MSHTEPDFLQDVINRLAAVITATQDGTPGQGQGGTSGDPASVEQLREQIAKQLREVREGVAKLSAEGKYIWSKRFGDPKNQPTSQACNGLGVDGAGNLFLVGRFDGGLNFGCGELTSAGQGDAFAGRLGP